MNKCLNGNSESCCCVAVDIDEGIDIVESSVGKELVENVGKDMVVRTTQAWSLNQKMLRRYFMMNMLGR